jgi:predicted amidophosphoribosyltransferase
VVWDEFTPATGRVGVCLACEESYTDTCARCGGPMHDGEGVCASCWRLIDDA